MSDSDIQLVRERRAEIGQIRASLDQEDADLAITEKTLARLQAAKTAARPNGMVVKMKTGAGLTQPEMIVGALRASGQMWMENSNELHDTVYSIYGVEINKNSFFPLLHDLEKREVIVRVDGKIALAERVKDRANREQPLLQVAQ